MIRIRSLIPVVLATLALAACNATTGGLGTLPPSSGSPEPSIAQGSPDVTAPPSGVPTPSPSTLPGSPSPTDQPSPSGGTAGTTIVRGYFLLGGGQGSAGLVPVLFEVPKTQAVATAAMNALLSSSGIQRDGFATMSTAIPAGTKLLGLSVAKGVATVDLSREFESGGGTASAFGRLAQVTYTLTQFPTVTSVAFEIEGQPVGVFGSDGIVLDKPSVRADFEDQLPAIFVDRPAFGAALNNPGRIAGTADVFEAQFRFAILDANGTKLVDQPISATCGTGCRGTFDVTVDYSVAKAQWGTLRVWDPSEVDGSPTAVRDYPVWLTPAG